MGLGLGLIMNGVRIDALCHVDMRHVVLQHLHAKKIFDCNQITVIYAACTS